MFPAVWGCVQSTNPDMFHLSQECRERQVTTPQKYGLEQTQTERHVTSNRGRRQGELGKGLLWGVTFKPSLQRI